MSAACGEDIKILSGPLHRLFLRANLGGSFDENNKRWIIPHGDDTIETLQRLLGHLRKYGLKFQLDEVSSALLEKVAEAHRAYQRIRSIGLKAKQPLSERVVMRLRQRLSSNFKRELTPSQLHGLHHILSVHHGANFSVPGGGKTSVVLAYYSILKREDIIDAVIVIGPASCFEPWKIESKDCLKRAPRLLVIAGKPKIKRREDYILANRYELLLTTYHSAARDVEEFIRVLQRRRYLVVLDESHYIKRPQGGILAESVLRLAPFAQRRVILTGTPMPNNLADLWTQLTFLWHDQLPLGSSEQYLRIVQNDKREEAIRHTKTMIDPLFFRVTKRELGLPRPKYHTIKCDMSALQVRIYRGVAARFLIQVNEAPNDREALRRWRRARAIRLLQIASNPALLLSQCEQFLLPPLDLTNIPLREAIEYYSRYEIPAKVESACGIVRQICQRKQKVIVWSMFVHNLKMVANQLKDLSPIVVHGGIPANSTSSEELDRARLIHKFKTDLSALVLVANPAACAESISLHKECHHAIYLDRSFNCAHYLQSLDRIHRLGLKSYDETSYYILLAKQSIDETVQLRLREKMQNMRKVLDVALPVELPGYWSEDLGEEEERDFALVERHIRTFA